MSERAEVSRLGAPFAAREAPKCCARRALRRAGELFGNANRGGDEEEGEAMKMEKASGRVPSYAN